MEIQLKQTSKILIISQYSL